MLRVLERSATEARARHRGTNVINALKANTSAAQRSDGMASVRVRQAHEQAQTYQNELDVTAECDGEGTRNYLRIKVRPAFV